jgi:hypothetical protein
MRSKCVAKISKFTVFVTIVELEIFLGVTCYESVIC